MIFFTATSKRRLSATYFCLSLLLVLAEPAKDASTSVFILCHLAGISNFIIACWVLRRFVDISNIDNHGNKA